MITYFITRHHPFEREKKIETKEVQVEALGTSSNQPQHIWFYSIFWDKKQGRKKDEVAAAIDDIGRYPHRDHIVYVYILY